MTVEEKLRLVSSLDPSGIAINYLKYGHTVPGGQDGLQDEDEQQRDVWAGRFVSAEAKLSVAIPCLSLTADGFQGAMRNHNPMSYLRTCLPAGCLAYFVLIAPVIAADINLSVEGRHIREDRSQVVFPVTDGAVLRSGDGLRVRLEVLERAPVYLMFVGSSGNPAMVLPGRQEDIGKPVPAGAVIEIPPQGTFFNLDDKTGHEGIFAFTGEATPRQIGLLLDDVRAAAGDMPQITRLIMDNFQTVERVAFEHIAAGPLAGIGFTVPERRSTGTEEGYAGVAEAEIRSDEPATSNRPRGFRFVIPKDVGDELDEVLSEEGSLIPRKLRIPDAADAVPATP